MTGAVGHAPPRVIHLTGDFPDPLDPAKTSAIRRLIDLTAERFDHQVFSLNRRTPSPRELGAWTGRRLQVAPIAFDYGLAAEYRAPPLGVFHVTMLERLGDWLADELTRQLSRPALIVGHKLTIEGIAVRRAAERLGVPYAISIQGNTDDRILRARPDLSPLLGRILRGAAAVFPFAPWTLSAIEHRVGSPTVNPRILPCATELDTPMAPQFSGNGLVTAFHLRNWRIKNLDRTIGALERLHASGERVSLAVLGSGTGPAAERARTLGNAVSGVRFEGDLDRRAMQRRLNAATALVMPSRRETFGMVFIEALFAGIPIIYPAGQGVDGYFDGAEFAVRVDARSVEAIAAAMAHVIRNEGRLKASLAEWQNSSDATRFQHAGIARQFSDGLTEAIASSAAR